MLQDGVLPITLVLLKEPLMKISSDFGFDVSDEEWRDYEELVSILEPIYVFTIQVQGNFNASKVYFGIYKILDVNN